jgi:ABC-type polysaccharide/polyol phosphate transport system ATPase subunit
VKGGIRFSNVRKVFRWRGPSNRVETLKGALFQRRWMGRQRAVREHVALDGVDFAVAPGETVAIIGRNGSGKSTCLKLAGGILRPTAGSVEVEGRVTALIELGAGFHPEISGRENVLINGMLLGLSRAEVEARMPEIVRFADIGDFVEQPVKTYSSGMYVRLGFAVAVAADPDILLIDEVLSVGDEAFTRRCLDRLARMRQRGVTMVLVSHDLDLVRAFADRAVYLAAGRVAADGPADAVSARYRSDAAGEAAGAEPAASGTDRSPARIVEEGRRWGNGDVEILAVEAFAGAGGGPQRLLASGEPCTLRLRYRVHRPVEDFVFGIAWHRADGAQVSGHNTALAGLEPRRLAAAGEVSCIYEALELAPGEYVVDAAVHAADGLAYDYWCDALRLRVTSEVEWPGVWAPRQRWRSSGPEWV